MSEEPKVCMSCVGEQRRLHDDAREIRIIDVDGFKTSDPVHLCYYCDGDALEMAIAQQEKAK